MNYTIEQTTYGRLKREREEEEEVKYWMCARICACMCDNFI